MFSDLCAFQRNNCLFFQIIFRYVKKKINYLFCNSSCQHLLHNGVRWLFPLIFSTDLVVMEIVLDHVTKQLNSVYREH